MPTSNRLIECICPKCGENHKMKLFWVGKSKPRKFCPKCSNQIAGINAIEYKVTTFERGNDFLGRTIANSAYLKLHL